MNRLVSSNLDQLSGDESLPPRKRSGRTRVLFINSNALGLARMTAQVRKYTAERDDVDAVHIDIARPVWVRALGKTFPVPHGWDLAAYRQLLIFRGIVRKWLNGPLPAERFDVIHVTTQGVAMAILDVKETSPAKWSICADSTAALEVRDFGASPTASAPMIAAEQKMFAAADLVVCLSRWAARSVEGDYKVPGERVAVFPGCVELGTSPSPRAAGDGPVRMLFVGNDWHRKGGPELLKLHQQRFLNRVELHVVSASATMHGKAHNVVWHGSIPNDQLRSELMPTMDFLVLPTRMDMSPFVIFEAAAAGLPAIATRIGAIDEMIVDGETGIHCQPGDWHGIANAVERLVSSAALRQRMGLAARDRVRENCDPSRVYNALIDRLVALAGKA